MTEAEGKKKGGAGKAIGIGCLVVILILAIGGFIVAKNIKKIGRSVGAAAITKIAETVVDESGLSAEEKASVMKPITDLAGEFKAGEMTMEQLGAIMSKIAEGPLVSLITVKAIEAKYIQASSLSAADKQDALKLASRYGEACAKGLITANADDQGLNAIIMTETTDSAGDKTTKLKDSLSSAELQQCLAIMKTAADSANIPDKMHQVDIGKAISDAIAKAKAEQTDQ